MTHRPPPQPPPLANPWAHIPMPQDASVIHGLLLERSAATLHRLDRIDHRLAIGDACMATLTAEVSALKDKPSGKSEPVPGWERALKGAAPYIIFLVTLAATGSAETAVKVLGLK